MRKNKIFYTIMEVLFIGIAPLIFIFLEYGSIGNSGAGIGFKLGFTGVLLCIVVFVILKRTVLKKSFNRLSEQISNHQSDLKIETDPGKIVNLKRELRSAKVFETLLSAVLPIFFLLGLLMLCSAPEGAILKLSGAVGFTTISFCVGTIFSVLNAREV